MSAHAISLAASREVRRIAVVRALYLGDLLLAVPALRALRTRYPKAEVTLIGLPWAAEFVRRFSRYVDRFVVFPGFPGIAEVDYEPERSRRFLVAQRAQGYDLVIQMHGSGEASNPFALSLGGRVTVGYFTGTPPEELAPSAPYPDNAPEVLRNLGLARLAGCHRLDARLEFPILAGDRAEANALLGGITEDKPIIGIHAGAKAPARRWSAERFAALADALIERFDATILLTGSAADGEITRAVGGYMRHAPVDLSGRTSLGGLAAVIERMHLLIGNDSGPAHLAEAVGTPSITLFGPTDPRRWAPLDQKSHRIMRRPVACSPCAYATCPIDHRCLSRITPEAVLALASEMLRKEVAACGA